MGKIINKNNKALLVFFVIILVLIGYKEINKKALTEVIKNNNTAQLNNKGVEEIARKGGNEPDKSIIKKEEIKHQPIIDNAKKLISQNTLQDTAKGKIESEIKNEMSENEVIVPEILNTAEDEKQTNQAPEETEGSVKGESTENAEDDSQKKYYKVIKVVDGDTISVDIAGISEIIRLIGINTPETKDPREPVECFGIEASNKAEELLAGQMVELEKDEMQDERDKYGRLLRYVKRKDGLFYNLEIIKQGYGYEYTYNIPYKYQKEFKEAENYARTNKLGLWADGACGMANIDNNTTSVPAPTPAQSANPESASQVSESQCECSSNKYNCADFKTHAEAQAIYDCCGGADSDIHKLNLLRLLKYWLK